MEMKIDVSGFGVSLPLGGGKTIGVGLLSQGVINFRHNAFHPKSEALLLNDLVSLCSGAFIGSWVVTSWFQINPEKDNWIYNINALIGRTAEIKFEGANIGVGEVDVTVTTYDKYGSPQTLVNQCCIEAYGGQLADMKVRGTLGRMSSLFKNDPRQGKPFEIPLNNTNRVIRRHQ